MNACCTGCSSSPSARPSIVVISRPTQFAAKVMQERTALPPITTVHVPHSDSSHAVLVPVRLKKSRKTSRSVSCPLRSSWYSILLMFSVVIVCFPPDHAVPALSLRETYVFYSRYRARHRWIHQDAPKPF